MRHRTRLLTAALAGSRSRPSDDAPSAADTTTTPGIYGEGSLASLDEPVTGTTGKIVPAMCVITNTGC